MSTEFSPSNPIQYEPEHLIEVIISIMDDVPDTHLKLLNARLIEELNRRVLEYVEANRVGRAKYPWKTYEAAAAYFAQGYSKGTVRDLHQCVSMLRENNQSDRVEAVIKGTERPYKVLAELKGWKLESTDEA